MTCDLDAAVPYYVAYVGGRWDENICDKPGDFILHADKGRRFLKRHFALSNPSDYYLVPYWARVLAETLASSSADPSPALMRAKTDDAFRGAVRAAFTLGGYVGLRDFLRGEGFIP